MYTNKQETENKIIHECLPAVGRYTNKENVGGIKKVYKEKRKEIQERLKEFKQIG